MKVIVFGATGMVGQGVLRECLLDPGVELVQTVGRSATGLQNAKLKELVHQDLWNYGKLEKELTGFDACFFCLGVSSGGMKEGKYRHLTYDLTLAAASMLARLNEKMTFVYVSGAGTDSSEQGRSMWTRVKGQTENALLQLPFKRAFMFRPGLIQPMNGARSKTPSYRVIYALLSPLLPMLKRAFPNRILSTEQIGRAMLSVAKKEVSKSILETRDIAHIAFADAEARARIKAGERLSAL